MFHLTMAQSIWTLTAALTYAAVKVYMWATD